MAPPGAGFVGSFGQSRDNSSFLQFPIPSPLLNPNGQGTDGYVVAAPQAIINPPPPPFIIYSDPNDAAGASISTIGYPGVSVFGFNGNTAFQRREF